MKKKYIRIGAFVVFAFLAFAGTTAVYHKNEVIAYQATKVIGSQTVDSMMSRIRASSVDDLILNSDLVVRGKVIDPGVTREQQVVFPNAQLQDKAETGSETDLTYKVACYQFQINEIIIGKEESHVISIVQLGEAGNDACETKLKQGDEMILVLNRDETVKSTYSSVSFEDGLFVIKSNKVYSLSDNKTMAKYDLRNVESLESDLQGAGERKERYVK